MKVICKCGAVYNLTPKFAGRKVNCKMCKRRLDTGDAPVKRKRSQKSAGPKTAEQIRREKEDAILAGYEEEMKRKEKAFDFIEETLKGSAAQHARSSAEFWIGFGVVFILLGIGVIVYYFLGGEKHPPILIMKAISGIWWIPPVLFFLGIWRLGVGISELVYARDLNLKGKVEK